MSLSRGLSLFKNIKTTVRINQQIRQSSDDPWAYRRGIPTPKNFKLVGDLMMGFTVWWILWHFWHEPGHIFGEYPYPDPTQWTDAQLGIPPDDEE